MTEREIKFEGNGNQGYSGSTVHMYFILRKPLGTVVLTTVIFDEHNQYRLDPMNLEYHSKTENPRLSGYKEHCEYLDQECYHDGSGLAADDAWEAMQRAGTEGLWHNLEEHYQYNIHDPNWIDCDPDPVDGQCYIPREKHWKI